ncbi:hypothetical protein EJA72_04625 [Pseudomonas sp. PB120]|uniref:hypothetical protein n=1 Tax=Pseudomonas sp. PB120 TaxID=2494700 RepID=UPI0012FDA746|nr:hypothetical protein [Pseudomonas sp. PB120]MVV47538.1 hypothetical protein [Pseudomonas sp. PB120]
MKRSERKIFLELYKAFRTNEPMSPEGMEAADRLANELLKVKPVGHPRLLTNDWRQKPAFFAALEVEAKVRDGETYTQATAMVESMHPAVSRTIERYRQRGKTLHLMVGQPMSSWKTLANVLPGDSHPFPSLPPRKMKLRSDHTN